MLRRPCLLLYFFFFNDTATTEIYTLSLHDALPISESPASPGLRHDLPPRSNLVDQVEQGRQASARVEQERARHRCDQAPAPSNRRSEEHTSELQSLAYLVCRLLLEKKKNIIKPLVH